MIDATEIPVAGKSMYSLFQLHLSDQLLHFQKTKGILARAIVDQKLTFFSQLDFCRGKQLRFCRGFD